MADKLFSGGRHVWAFHIRSMYTAPYSDTVAIPFYERYFMGGDYDLRGFDIRGISPYGVVSTIQKDNQGVPLIDMDTGSPLRRDILQPLGGDLYALAQMEYRIPLVGPVSLAVFGDIGLTTITQQDHLGFSPDSSVYLIDGTNKVWRSSTGLELQFMLPMINAPFRLIFAYNPLTLTQTYHIRGQAVPIFYTEPDRNIQFTIGKSF